MGLEDSINRAIEEQVRIIETAESEEEIALSVKKVETLRNIAPHSTA